MSDWHGTFIMTFLGPVTVLICTCIVFKIGGYGIGFHPKYVQVIFSVKTQ